jgi:flagellar motor switch protein FliM
MKLEQTFTPARPLAQHCPELTARGPRPEERAESIAGWRRDIARALTQDLAALFSGGALKVELSEPEWLSGAQVFARVGPVAANSLLRCRTADRTLLLSFDHPVAIALTDLSFGGEGVMADAPVEALPRSAALLVDQVAKAIANAIAAASARDGDGPLSADVIARSESAARLKPFGADTPCALFTLTLTTGKRSAWSGLLALPAARLDSLLPGLSSGEPAPARPRGPADGTAAPFGTIPLSLRAVLAEFSLSLGQLERLRPGDRIPLAVAREVPLRIGTTTLAHGTIGTRQDQLALQLTTTTAGGTAS